jgi:hypothetical protein
MSYPGDIVPTLLDLEGLEQPPKMSGRRLMRRIMKE